MDEQNGNVSQTGNSRDSGQPDNSENQTGDPGRTPGKAEGDEETIEESLKQKES